MKFPITGVITLLTLLAAQPAAAQSVAGNTPTAPAGGDPVAPLPEIVVSASRVPLEARAVGSSVTVITADRIERRQVRVVSDLLREVPGVAVHRSGTVGTLTAVRIRGAEHGHTLVIIDGVKVNDPSSSGAIFNFADLLAADIERIEILRGPQSGVYGSDAIGGVINIVTQKGHGPAVANLAVEGGSFGTGNVSTGVRGGGDGYHFSLGATAFTTSGISIAAGSEKDGYRNQTYNAKLGVEPFPDLEMELSGRYVKSNVETDNVPTDNSDETDLDHVMGGTRFNYSLFDGSWKHAAGAAMHRKRRAVKNRWGTSRFDGRKSRIDYETSLFFETWAVAEAAHTVTLGAERGKDAQTSGGNSSDFTHRGYAGEYQIGLQDRLFLSGGLRRDDNERFTDTTTFRLTAAYVLDDRGTRFHGSYGTGIKNPTLSQIFQQFGRVGPNPDVEPEESRGWDVGVELNLLAGRLSLDATYFNNRLTDLIHWYDAGTPYDRQNPETGDDDYYTNLDGVSWIRGLELTAQANPAEALHLSVQYTYTDTEDPDGEPLPRRPRHVASINLGYELLDGKATLDLGIDYHGKQLNRKANPVMLDGFYLVNLAAAYRVTRRVELFGRIDNLLDEDYEEVPGYRTTGIRVFAGIRGTLELFR